MFYAIRLHITCMFLAISTSRNYCERFIFKEKQGKQNQTPYLRQNTVLNSAHAFSAFLFDIRVNLFHEILTLG